MKTIGKAWKGPVTLLVLPDIHYPLHDWRALSVVRQVAKTIKVDAMIQLGDFLDLEGLGRWTAKSKGEGDRLKADIALGAEGLAEIMEATRKLNPACRGFMLEGNHEQRIKRDFLLEGLVDLPELMSFRELGVTWIPADSEAAVLRFDWAGKGQIKARHYTRQDWMLGDQGIAFCHGWFTGLHAAKKHSERYARGPIFFGHCFDDQTEILGRDGWLKRSELHAGSEVMTYNRDREILELNAVSAITDYPAGDYPELVRVKARSVDLAVTGKHGLLDFKHEIIPYNAEDFGKAAVRIFKCAGEVQREDYPLTDDQLRLCVWIAADGHLAYEPTSSIRFNLKKVRKINRLKNLLCRLRVDFKSSADGAGKTRLRFHAPEFIKSLFDWGHKCLPKEFWGLSARQGRILIAEYGHTDGTVLDNGYQISTSKETEADQIQTIAVSSGFRCNTHLRKTGCWSLAV